MIMERSFSIISMFFTIIHKNDGLLEAPYALHGETCNKSTPFIIVNNSHVCILWVQQIIHCFVVNLHVAHMDIILKS